MVEKVTLGLQPVREVLGFLGDSNLGVAPRPVVCRILQLANIADAETLEKVAAEWPELTYAWFVARRTAWGLDWLRGIAKAGLDGVEQGLDFSAVQS